MRLTVIVKDLAAFIDAPEFRSLDLFTKQNPNDERAKEILNEIETLPSIHPNDRFAVSVVNGVFFAEDVDALINKVEADFSGLTKARQIEKEIERLEALLG